jgi:glutathione S-transferase
MIKVHDYAGSANGYKVRLLLALLELPFERVEVDIFRGEASTPDFLRKNPAGRVPVLEPEPGVFLAESSAILWYLAEGTPYLPEGRLERGRTLQWLSFEQDSIESQVGSARFWRLTGRAAARPEALALKMAAGERGLATMDRHLGDHPFFVGDNLTIADVALHAYSHLAPEGGFDLGRFPAVRAWIGRVESQTRFFAGPGPYTQSAMVAPTITGP